MTTVMHGRRLVGVSLVRPLGAGMGSVGGDGAGSSTCRDVAERGGRSNSGGAHQHRAGKHTRAHQTNGQGAR